MAVAKKDFWNHLKFDNENILEVQSKFRFTRIQFDKVKNGYIPDDIASRFLAYFENEALFIHSIMSGYCYYKVIFNESFDKIYCEKIIKFIQFRPDENEEQIRNSIKLFFQYSISVDPIDEFHQKQKRK